MTALLMVALLTGNVVFSDPPVRPHPSGVIALLGPRTVPRPSGPARPYERRILVLFDYGIPATDGESMPDKVRTTLDRHKAELQKAGKVVLVGRADEYATYARTEELARRRAEMVAHFIKAMPHGPALEIQIMPVKREPLPGPDTEERCSYHLDRTVDIVIAE